MANPWDNDPIVGDEARTAPSGPWDSDPIVSRPAAQADDDGVIQWLADGGIDFAQGFNEKLAEFMGFTVSAGTNLLLGPGSPTKLVREILLDAQPEFDLDRPESVANAIKRSAAKIGMIDTDGADNLANQMGRDTFNAAAVIASFMLGGAPAASGLTALAGRSSGFLPSLARGGADLINTALRHPGTFATAEVGAGLASAPAGELAANVAGEEYRVLGELAGATVGGGLGGPTIARTAGRAAGAVPGAVAGAGLDLAVGLPGPGSLVGASVGARVGRRAVDAWLTRGSTPKSSVVSGDVSPAEARDFAATAIAGDMDLADLAVQKAIRDVGGSASPMKKAEALRGAVRLAYARAQKESNRLWGQVDKTKLVPVTRLRHYASTIVDHYGEFRSEAIPGEIIAKLRRLGVTETVQTPAGPKTLRGDHASIGNLLQIRASIGDQLREPGLNNELRHNLMNLDRAILNSIRKAYPNDKAMETASQYTLWLHNRFSRGPLGEFLGRGARNSAFMTEPERKALRLIESEQGAQQLADVNKLVPSIATKARDVVQAEFQRMAADAQSLTDPQQQRLAMRNAHRWLGSPEVRRFVRNYPKAQAELEAAHTNLTDALASQAAINDSFLLKFSQLDPQEAVNSLWTGKNKLDRAREITSSLMGDDTGRALASLRAGMVDRLLAQSAGNAERAKSILAQRDLRQAFVEVMGQDGMKRLDRILNSADAVAKGATKRATAVIENRLARILGASAGRALGFKTIQGTGQASELSAYIYNAVNALPVSNQMVYRALYDPKWERYLNTLIPSNVSELHKETDAIRALVIGLEAGERVPSVSE